MFFVYVLAAALLCYGTIDLLLRVVYTVLFFGEKRERCHVFFLMEQKEIESIVLRIQFQRFFLPKESRWIVVDCRSGAKKEPLAISFCGEKDISCCSWEEFIKLTENSLQPAEKLL